MKNNQDLLRLVAHPDMDLMSFPEGTETKNILRNNEPKFNKFVEH